MKETDEKGPDGSRPARAVLIVELKRELSCKLHGAAAARSNDRVRCCNVRSGARATKSWHGRIVLPVSILPAVRIGEVRVVENIEELRPELQPLYFPEVKVLGNGDIQILEARIREHIPAHITELPETRRNHDGVPLCVAAEQV